jgi:tRNA nucleotidyltransferase (CCA-adding enzyme)
MNEAAAPAPMTEPVISEPVLDILRRLETAGFETWCVGGAIRDALRGHVQRDVDLATAATPEQVQQLFRRTVPVGIAHGTVGVLDDFGGLHEVTTFRRDVQTDGRHAVVVFGVSLDDDLARRDFTINAVAFHPLQHQWRDPFDGRLDLQQGVLRAVGEPALRFREDRLRILRGLRFAARFALRFDADTWAQAGATGHLSAERVRDEWTKGIASAVAPGQLVEWWKRSGVAAVWLPELVTNHGTVPDQLRDPVLVSALVCGAAAPVWRRFKGSTYEIQRAEAIDRGPAQPEHDGPAVVRHWLAQVGTAAQDLMLLAQIRSGVVPPWTEVAAACITRGDPTTRSALAVQGHDLLAAGIGPGREMGAILAALLDVVLDDPGLNTKEALLACIPQLRSRQG